MNTQRVVASALSSIVLAFIIKGYFILQLVDDATRQSLQVENTQSLALHHDVQSFEKFLYLSCVLVVVIIAPFIFKIKKNQYK